MIFNFHLKAQAPKSFTADPVQFPKEMQAFLESSIKKDAENLMEKFLPVWQANKFSPEQQKTIYEFSNDMLRKRMKPFPDFANYLNALIGFANSNQSAESFKNWHFSLEKGLSTTTKRLSDYIENCYVLFVKNEIYESSSVAWVAGSNKYTFEFDSMPKVVFPAMNLTCLAKNDSSVIYNTQCIYYPNLKKIIGKGGHVNWNRGGLTEAEAYADLNTYTIDVSGSDYIIDSVTFHYPKYFSGPLSGTFSEKILSNVTPENASWPRFTSYQQTLDIKNLIKDAQYRGGFALQGNKMIGGGSDLQDASLIFNRDGKPFLIATSKSFTVRPERVSSENAAITILWDKDSITHPGVNFKYVYSDKKLSLYRDTRGAQQSPFFDSYHNVEMYFDELSWKITDPLMDLKMTVGEGEAKLSFESDNYYRKQRFEKILGIAEETPLYTLKKYSQKYNTNVVNTKALAQEMHMADDQVRSMLISLSNAGYVSFDFKTDAAMIKDKLYYFLKAWTGKTDYESLIWESQISGAANATINLLNFDIRMRGVSNVQISDSQNVYVVPDSQEVVMHKDRNFSFNGKVHAGRLDFYGSNFEFGYEDFKFKLKNIDSLRMRVPTDIMDEKGNPRMARVKNVLQNLSGELLIDSLNNKSGLKPGYAYPLFTALTNAFLYYDASDIRDGVYNRDKFYFKTDPFIIDSADYIIGSSIKFDGNFVSNIFPDSRETLVLQPDYSLGFTKETTAEGLPMYGGKATFNNKIHLSNNGLEGDGEIKYLSSLTKSDKIIFFPDSTLAEANSFAIEKKTIGTVAYPEVKATDVLVDFEPKKDYMDIKKKDKDFTLYEQQVSLDGNLRLSPKGLGGYGTTAFFGAQLVSNDFRFQQTTFGADTAEFRLRSDDSTVYAIDAKNFNSTIDLALKTGDFKSNAGKSKIDFPINQYLTYIEQFKWFIDPRELEFNSPVANKLGSEFISTHPLQDSVRFFSPSARYNLKDYLIKAKKVKEILIADASIQPDSGNVTVEKAAHIQTLTNAIVIADTATKYHTIVNANIEIASRKRYEGTGDYEYTDQAKVKHLLHLDRIAIDTAFHTYATGEIADTSNFTISPNTLFKGKVKILAAHKFLNFDGFALVNHACEKVEKNWFSFASEINPEKVKIPIVNPVNETHEKLTAGIYLTSASDTSSGFYSTFLSPKIKVSDQELVAVTGLLTFDNKSKEYRIVSDTINGSDSVGNYISLNDEQCRVYAEGLINLGINFGQFKTKFAGSVTNNMNLDSTDLNLVVDCDFPFNEESLKSMADVFLSYPNLKPTDDLNTLYNKSMSTVTGKEKWAKASGELAQSGALKRVPDELKHSIILSNVKLKWNNASKSYRSVGNIGVAFIYKNAISRYLKGNCEIVNKKGSNGFNLYLEIDANTWYFFSFSRNIMQAVSSDPTFNDVISKEKDEKRLSKGKDDLPDFQYMLSTERKKNEFLKKLTEIEE
ncbi:MAG: hypothetical protein ABI723_05980 [Bacteroidia bacterium]